MYSQWTRLRLCKMNQVFPAVLLLLVFSAAATLAQREYKCESPHIWYSDFSEFNPVKRDARFGIFFYDEDGARIAVREEAINQNTNYTYDEVFLYKEKVGYRKNVKTGVCQKFTLTDAFPVIGPYDSDKYDGEAYIGSSAKPKDGVAVKVYSGTIAQGRFSSVWVPMSDGSSCLPVSETFAKISDKSASVMKWYNIRLGIMDFSVFDPPTGC